MWPWFLLAAMSVLLVAIILTGIGQFKKGHDVKGTPPIEKPLFLITKVSMGGLWGMAKRFGSTWNEYTARVPRYGNPFHCQKGWQF